MKIVYQDEIGFIECTVDDGITFCKGVALFESNGKHYRVPTSQLFEIIDDAQTHDDEKPLRVCPHCLQAIESREGKQITRMVYFDDDENPRCEWCEETADDGGFDRLYEIL